MIAKEEERGLVQAILDGDKDKFAIIVKEYQEIVQNLTYRLMGNKLDVEDITQQVFVELYVSLPHFRFESRLNTFIYRITVNVISKIYRKESRMVSYDAAEQDTASTELNEEERIIKEEQRQRLRKAIGQLHPEQRTALILCTYENFSYQEISDVMQCSFSKVESLIFRAKKNLKKILDKDAN